MRAGRLLVAAVSDRRTDDQRSRIFPASLKSMRSFRGWGLGSINYAAVRDSRHSYKSIGV